MISAIQDLKATLFNINKLNEKQIAATELGISVVRFDNAIKPSRGCQKLRKITIKSI